MMEVADRILLTLAYVASGLMVVWLVLGVVLGSRIASGRSSRRVWLRWLSYGLVANGLAVLILGAKVSLPLVLATTVAEKPETLTLPNYDLSAWHSLPVQHAGRDKPFESACIEILRHVTGRSRFEGHDAVEVVLSWMLLDAGRGPVKDLPNWDRYPFILCDHHQLRRIIFKDKFGDEAKVTAELVHGKYVSPADLNDSDSFRSIIDQIRDKRQKYGDKYQQYLTPVERKAEEALGRLRAFQHVAQNHLMSGQAMLAPLWSDIVPLGSDPNLPLFARIMWPDTRFYRLRAQKLADELSDDPIQFVALDRVRHSPWFSIGQVYACFIDPTKWRATMRERMSRAPQRYIKPEMQLALRQFQERLLSGNWEEAVDDLYRQIEQRHAAKIEAFRQRHATVDTVRVRDLVRDDIFLDLTTEEQRTLGLRLSNLLNQGSSRNDPTIQVSVVANAMTELLDNRLQRAIGRLRSQVRQAVTEGYDPDDDRFRMLALNFLEARFPLVYRESETWQPFPVERAGYVVLAYEDLRRAYQSGDASRFAEASQTFFTVIQQVSDRTLADSYALVEDSALRTAYQELRQADATHDWQLIAAATDRFLDAVATTGEEVPRYPAASTIDLELQFNRVQPFMWAWVIMFLALALFGVSMATSWRPAYMLAFAAYLISIGFQLYGFYARVAISGRAPVSNMYETVIWVAFMSAIFALILELIYRKKVIGLAGALVSTIGLVLADQLPVALDPKISPLVPVLRSNYWLIIHVLTIVSSYAGGTLAWGLGNLTLAMLAFSRPSQELLKTLSYYTYRAIQIAVILLAAGTFLGGWWAVESWGRFWGWDPKEVWALIALVVYIIPLHARYIGWVKDFGLAVCSVLCYSAIVMAWYGVNFVIGAGLHSYGFGGGGPWWVFLAGLVNVQLVLYFARRYLAKTVLAGEQTAATG